MIYNIFYYIDIPDVKPQDTNVFHHSSYNRKSNAIKVFDELNNKWKERGILRLNGIVIKLVLQKSYYTIRKKKIIKLTERRRTCKLNLTNK